MQPGEIALQSGGSRSTDLDFSKKADPAAARRVEWIDVAKGITIILVVLFHALRGLLNAGEVAHDPGILAIDYAVYSFHMPVFFFLSGLFMRRTLQKPAWAFWTSRFRILLLPYFIWMTVELVLITREASLVNTHNFSLSLGAYLWNPIAPYWFLYSLFCISAVLYAVQRLSDRAVLALAALAYAVSWVWYARFGSTIQVHTASGFVFVSLGMLLAKYTEVRLSPRWALLSTVVLFVGVAVTSFPFHAWGFRVEASLPAGLLGVAGTVILSKMLAGSRLSPGLGPIKFLGRISLTILVTHIIGTAGARIVLAKFLGVYDPLLHLMLDTSAGLAIGVAVQWAAWSAGVTQWLGLPDLPVRLLSQTIGQLPQLSRHEPAPVSNGADP